MVITIDGPAGSGKSTVARSLASCLHIRYLDTGAMYRALAVWFVSKGVDPLVGNDMEACLKEFPSAFHFGDDNKVFLLGAEVTEAIRDPDIDMLSSHISQYRAVREMMVELQRLEAKKGSIVAEGRDMGTVVFPFADWKFYLTADIEVRAERRYKELVFKGIDISYSEVLEKLRERDVNDMNREIAPLIPAEDAYILDTSNLGIDEVLHIILERINKSNKVDLVSFNKGISKL